VGSPALDAVLQMGPPQSRAEGEENLPRPAGSTPLEFEKEKAYCLKSFKNFKVLYTVSFFLLNCCSVSIRLL